MFYTYKALDAKGKEVIGEIESSSQSDAIAKMRNSGLFPINLKAKSKVEDKIIPSIIKSGWRDLLGDFLIKCGNKVKSSQ